MGTLPSIPCDRITRLPVCPSARLPVCPSARLPDCQCCQIAAVLILPEQLWKSRRVIAACSISRVIES